VGTLPREGGSAAAPRCKAGHPGQHPGMHRPRRAAASAAPSWTPRSAKSPALRAADRRGPRWPSRGSASRRRGCRGSSCCTRAPRRGPRSGWAGWGSSRTACTGWPRGGGAGQPRPVARVARQPAALALGRAAQPQGAPEGARDRRREAVGRGARMDLVFHLGRHGVERRRDRPLVGGRIDRARDPDRDGLEVERLVGAAREQREAGHRAEVHGTGRKVANWPLATSTGGESSAVDFT
jgi:hypothetical protein